MSYLGISSIAPFFSVPHPTSTLYILDSSNYQAFLGLYDGLSLLLVGRCAGFSSQKSDRVPSQAFHFLFSLSLWVSDFLFVIVCFLEGVEIKYICLNELV